MKSRERIRKLLQRQIVDRIPNGLGGSETSGLHSIAYDNLKEILGVSNSPSRINTFLVNAIVEPEVLEQMHGDILLIGSPRLGRAHHFGPQINTEWKNQKLWNRNFRVPIQEIFTEEPNGTVWWENNLWTRMKCPNGSLYFDPDYTKLKPLTTDPDKYHPPHDLPDDLLRTLEESARWSYENTGYALCCGETICDFQIQPGGPQSWWMMLLDNPDVANEFLHKSCEAALSQLKLLDQAVGKYTDLLMMAHDMGDVRGVTIGPDLWRDIYKPHYKKLFTKWHEITNMKVFLHSCGAISDILGDLIDCGVDVINPVQISARGMEPKRLKDLFGDRVIFYGGAFDAVQTPPGTSAEEVYEKVKENIKILSKDGGYIFAGVHNIPGDTPKEHLKSILAAYFDCCG